MFFLVHFKYELMFLVHYILYIEEANAKLYPILTYKYPTRIEQKWIKLIFKRFPLVISSPWINISDTETTPLKLSYTSYSS